MISDEERREVAARLRNNLMYMRKNKKFYLCDLDVVECGNKTYRNIAASVERFANFESGNYIHICETLADLIDRPTCEMRIEGEGFRCSACGTYFDMSGFEKFPWPHCPNCSAEVI